MTTIKVNTTVNAPVEKAWESFTSDSHITKWNFASEDWECPFAKSDFKEGGSFVYRMSAKDESMAFDFGGTFITIVDQKKISYTLEDGRKVNVEFVPNGDNTTDVIQEFEAETSNPEEMQKMGWQAILTNYKKYTESI